MWIWEAALSLTSSTAMQLIVALQKIQMYECGSTCVVLGFLPLSLHADLETRWCWILTVLTEVIKMLTHQQKTSWVALVCWHCPCTSLVLGKVYFSHQINTAWLLRERGVTWYCSGKSYRINTHKTSPFRSTCTHTNTHMDTHRNECNKCSFQT